MTIRKWWVLLLSVLLILWGLLTASNFQFDASGLILGVLAIASGVLLFIDR